MDYPMLTTKQRAVIAALYQRGSSSANRVAKAIGSDWSSTRDTLFSLEHKGLVSARETAIGADLFELTELGSGYHHCMKRAEKNWRVIVEKAAEAGLA